MGRGKDIVSFAKTRPLLLDLHVSLFLTRYVQHTILKDFGGEDPSLFIFLEEILISFVPVRKRILWRLGLVHCKAGVRPAGSLERSTCIDLHDVCSVMYILRRARQLASRSRG